MQNNLVYLNKIIKLNETRDNIIGIRAPMFRQRIIPKAILKQEIGFKGEAAECSNLHERNLAPQHSFSSFKMGNGMRRYIITAFFSMLLVARPVQADLLSGCIVGYDFGNIVQESIDLYPINSTCATNCQSNCISMFSRSSDSGTELNADVIDRCQSFCQSGEIFSSYYRESTGATDIYGNAITNLTGPSTMAQACSQVGGKVWARAVRSTVTFNLGDSISIALGSNSYGNKIYSCGKDNVTISPLYKADTAAGWNAANGQNLWKNTYDHYCLNYLNQSTGSGQLQVLVPNLQVGNLMSVPSIYNPDNQCYAFVMSPLMTSPSYTAISTDESGNVLANANFTALVPNVPGQPFQYSDSASSNNTGLYRRINDLVNWYNDGGTYAKNSGTKGFSGPCRFNALEENVIDTGLYVNAGDELSILWKGNFNRYNDASSVDVNNNPIINTSPNLMTQVQRAMTARNLSLSSNYPLSTTTNSSFLLSSTGFSANSYINMCNTLLNQSSSLELYFGSNPVTVLNGENARNIPICVPQNLASPSATAPAIYGLTGMVKDNALCTFGYLSQADINSGTVNPSCSAQNNNNLANSSCYFINTMDHSKYAYAGILSGVTTDRVNLAIRMNDYAGQFADNAGGVDVNITWGGCPITDGANVQYFVSACNLDAQQLDDSYPWVTFAQGTVYPQSISIPSTAPTSSASGIYVNSGCTGTQYYVYMRLYDPYISQTYVPASGDNVDSFTNTINAPQSNLTNLYGSPGSRYGYYSMQVQRVGLTSANQADYTMQIGASNQPGIMQKLAKFIMQTIIGTQSAGYSDGILMKSYQDVTSGNMYLGTVRAMLVMYVAFLALSFIMGLSDFTQKEAVSHLLKMSLITLITSGQSWSLFSSYVLPLCVNGSAQIAAMVSSNGFTADDQALIAADPTYLISYIDQAISSIWASQTMWLKCLALMFSSFWGFIFALLLIAVLLIYTVGLLKVVIVYCFAIMGLGFLVFLAPVMLPMCLFKFTQPIFEKWWKNMLSYAVQPIMLFASVCIINFLTMTTLYATLNFSICPVCFLQFEFFGYEYCPLEIYVNSETLHAGNNADGKIGSFLMQSSVILLTLSYIMFEMPGVFTSIASRLITGGSTGTSAGGRGSASESAFNQMGVNDVGEGLKTAGKAYATAKAMPSAMRSKVDSIANLMKSRKGE